MAVALSRETYLRSTRFPALDGVRAISVLLVVTWHVQDGAFARINGDYGVDIFFILSGFLITTLLLREEARKGTFSYTAFMIRRIFRIWPLLFFGIGVYSVAIFIFHLDPREHAFLHAIPYYVGYLPEVPFFDHPAVLIHGEGPAPFSGVWSLGIEEKFYLLWPLLAFVVLRRSRARVWVACVLALGFWFFAAYGPVEPARFVINYAPILLGCFTALALESQFGYRVFVVLTQPWLATLFFVVVAVANLRRWPVLEAAGHEVLTAIVMVAVVIRPESRGAKVLGLRWIARIGVLSYALYLFHSLALKVADKMLPHSGSLLHAYAIFIVGLALAIASCEVLHRVIESPMQRLGRRLAERRAPRSQSAVGALLPETRPPP